MRTVNTGPHEVGRAADATETLRFELAQCRRELAECHKRMGELERAEALHAGEKRLLEMVAQGDALAGILDSLCRHAEKLTGGPSFSILLVSADGKSLRHGAAPSLAKRYTQAIDGGLIGPRSGSCGTAAYRKEPVVVSDIETDPLWADYRHLAWAEGLRACWSTPIFSTTREVLGTFALYCREPASPTPEQHGVVEQFAHFASIAIERTLAQEALRRSEAYLAEAQRLSLTGSFGWCVASGELIWSAETFCILGYDLATRPTLELVFGNDMDTYADDLATLVETLDLKNAIHVGHSTGGGEVARYIGHHGTKRVARTVLIGAVPPLMLKTASNPGGLPIEVFDQIRSGVVADRSQFFKDLAMPFYGYNRPGAKISEGVRESFWLQGMMAGFPACYFCIKAFSETDLTGDLKKFDVPTLVLHGDDDQIVPIADSALLSAKLIKNATLKVYKGAPHGMCTTLKDRVNEDLLAFIKS